MIENLLQCFVVTEVKNRVSHDTQVPFALLACQESFHFVSAIVIPKIVGQTDGGSRSSVDEDALFCLAGKMNDVNVEIHNHCTHEHLQEDRANEVGKNQCINELSDVIKCYIGNNQEGDGLQ